jgi:hypothetical protein
MSALAFPACVIASANAVPAARSASRRPLEAGSMGSGLWSTRLWEAGSKAKGKKKSTARPQLIFCLDRDTNELHVALQHKSRPEFAPLTARLSMNKENLLLTKGHRKQPAITPLLF